MGFKEAIRTCFKEKYATFQGRASRSEYWYFVLFLTLASGIPALIGLGLMLNSFQSGGDPGTLAYVFFAISGLVYLALLLPYISVYVRRFHDRNLSGWWVLGALLCSAIPYIGWLISLAALIIVVLKGTEGENKYGPDPLGMQRQADVFA